MLQAAPYLIGFVLPLLVVWSRSLGGAMTFLPLAYVYVVVPLVDTVSALDTRNASREDVGPLEANQWFRLVTWLWVPVQLVLLGWALGEVSGGALSGLELTGLALSVGVTTGAVGITFAHELVHRPGRLERALGEILLASVSYTHFAIEHVHGHHRHVATPEDPATARAGESFYAFYPRTIVGGLLSAMRIEAARLHKRGLGPWHWRNRFWRYAVTQAALYVGVALTWGAAAAVFTGVQAVVAFTLLEVINYVEHYGLERRRLPDGRYERVMPWHSWNSSHRMSNWLLINLARHSDHHWTASKRYQTLDHLDEAPQLPAGYGTMFVVALVPPLWRRMLDPRVSAWRARHLRAADA